MLNLKVFVPQLKQAIIWTAELAKNFDVQDYWQYGTVFRQLNPIIDGKPLFTIDRGYTSWNVDVYELTYFEQALWASLAQRSTRLEERVPFYNDFRKLGRILCFETQMTTHDGAAVAQSSGFVDESDVPPLDTWFYLGEVQKYNRSVTILFCWIPRQFEPIMQQAIDVEIMNSYHWFDEYGLLSNQALVAAMAA